MCWRTSSTPPASGPSSSSLSGCGWTGSPPQKSKLQAYCDRLNELKAAGGRLKAIQLYTIARKPAEARVTPLADAELDAVAAFVRARVEAPIDVFYGVAG